MCFLGILCLSLSYYFLFYGLFCPFYDFSRFGGYNFLICSQIWLYKQIYFCTTVATIIQHVIKTS